MLDCRFDNVLQHVAVAAGAELAGRDGARVNRSPACRFGLDEVACFLRAVYADRGTLEGVVDAVLDRFRGACA